MTDESVVIPKQLDEVRLRYHIVERQDGLCMCGHTLDNMAIHEVLITKGDLPKDKRVRNPINVVGVHNDMPCGLGGHIHEGHTDKYQMVCYQYLLREYDWKSITAWILSLNLKSLPRLAKEIVNAKRYDSDGKLRLY